MRVEGAHRLCNACKTTEEKLVLWTLLHTGLKGIRAGRPDALTPPVAAESAAHQAYFQRLATAKALVLAGLNSNKGAKSLTGP
jgi:hypothetical protein